MPFPTDRRGPVIQAQQAKVVIAEGDVAEGRVIQVTENTGAPAYRAQYDPTEAKRSIVSWQALP